MEVSQTLLQFLVSDVRDALVDCKNDPNSPHFAVSTPFGV